MYKLAISGGESIRKKSWPKWPAVGKAEIEIICDSDT